MGDIKRKKRKFRKPKKPFDKARIEEENKIIKKYGLKNKREIWKAESEISKIRKRAKSLISSSDKEKVAFLEKLKRIGLKINNIEDILALTKEDWLDRRLQTFVLKKNLVNTIKHARQIIVHKQVLVNDKIVNKPSFIITKNLEDKIKIKKLNKQNKKSKEND